MRKHLPKSYIACDEKVDFGWSPEQVKDFDRLWNKGKGLTEIGKYFNRSEVDVLMLVVDRGFVKGKIKQRPINF